MDWISPDQTARLLTGHVLERLRDLPDASVHCVVTSPPYWGLRAYQTGRWVGGDPACEHERLPSRGGRGGSGPNSKNTTGSYPDERPASSCSRCGAVYVDHQFGAEPLHDCLGWATCSPCGECFVCHLVAVMREVRRVLHPSGTVWLNLGDSFANDGKWGGTTGGKHAAGLHGEPIGRDRRQTGLKPKDQCMIPARTALALQADGWWVRSDVIWAKPSCMPGSQRDRPTCSHEYVYLLAKSDRYFYDDYAIRESVSERTANENPIRDRNTIRFNGTQQGTRKQCGLQHAAPNGSRTARTIWHINPQPFRGAMCRACRTVYLDGTQRFARQDGDKAKPICPTCGAWDQWLSHFAVMPERLAERCILAGTSERGVCPKCGEPWRRVLDKTQQSNAVGAGGGLKAMQSEAARVAGEIGRLDAGRRAVAGSTFNNNPNKRPLPPETIGWQPACQCVDGPFPDFIGDHQPTVGTCSPPEPVAATVLDPFAGTGTTLAVARRLGRHAIGIELNPDYAEICQARVMAPPRKPKTARPPRPQASQPLLF